MSTMPLVQVHGVDDVRIDQVGIPSPGPADVLVQVAACGICGSDLGYIAQGGLASQGAPMPLGHEISGTVLSMGERVQHLTAGQRVTVNPMANQRSIGNGGREGAFSPYLLVRDAAIYRAAVLPLPDAISFEQGAMIEPLAVAMHGVRQSRVQPGQAVAVLGAGPIGLSTVVALRHLGIDNILVADLSARRLGVAEQLGARATCNVAETDLAEMLKQHHGVERLMGAAVPGTDIYIEATGVASVLTQCIALAKQGAGVTVVGVHKEPIELHPLNLLIKELHLTGSMAYSDEFPAVIEMLASDHVDIMPLVSHRFALAHFEAALACASDPNHAIKVIVRP